MSDKEDFFKETQSKLTDWENEPSLKALQDDLDTAKNTHDGQVAKITKWRKLLEAPRVNTSSNRSGIQPKLIRRQAEWRYSALSEPFLSNHKLFNVHPRTFEDAEAARQNEILLNYQFSQKLNKIKLIDDFVHSTVDEGTGILKVGWLRKTEQKTEEVPVYQYYDLSPDNPQDGSMLEALQQAMELKQHSPRDFDEKTAEELKEAVSYFEKTGVPVTAVPTGETVTNTYEVPVINQPTVELINPSNIYVDPGCQGDIDKAMFVIQAFETTKAELSIDGRYKNLDKVKWDDELIGTDGTTYETPTPSDYSISGKARKKVLAFEYWGFYDIHNNDSLVPIVATWIGDVLIRMEENPFPDGKVPYVFVPYTPVKRELFGEPDAEVLEDNQKILGAITRGLIDSLGRSANAQIGFSKGMLDFTNRMRYEKGEDYEFNPTMSPTQGIIEHKYPELSQSAILMLQMQNQEAESLTGIKAFSGGLAGDSYNSKVATAINGVINAAGKREMSILRRLAKGITQIGEKIVAMNAEFLSDEEVVRITNKEFIPIKREDIKGNFDLEVDIATVEVDNEKAQDMAFLLQTMGPNMPMEISMLIISEIADLKRMPELADKLRNYKPEPTPEQQLQMQLAQAQLALAQANIEKTRVEAQKLQVDAQVSMANASLIGSKDILTRAQATNAQASANKQNAQAIGQQIENSMLSTGTKHLQEMEKMQAQARGNQSLEVTKALLKARKPEESAPNIDAAIGYNTLTNQSDNII